MATLAFEHLAEKFAELKASDENQIAVRTHKIMTASGRALFDAISKKKTRLGRTK